MTGPEAARRLLSSPTLRDLAAAWPAGRAYLTGGSLRDRLLGLAVHDWDLIMDGDPARAARALARRYDARAFQLGRPPRVTWRVARPGVQFDLVGVQSALEDDIRRRDFTVNALVWRLPRGPLIDLVGGLEDLAAGRIRAVNEANLRADPLRVLRGFRLAATRPGLRLTAECERQLAAAASGLGHVAQERVHEELRLLLLGPAAARSLTQAARCAVLSHILPGWDDGTRSRQAAQLAGVLAGLARSRSRTVAAGASQISPAVLAAPAAGFPDRWEEAAASAALERCGWAPRAARRVAAAAATGLRLVTALPAGQAACREVAAACDEAFPLAVAWAIASSQQLRADPQHVSRLLRWWRTFSARPPLLGGDEVTALLRLGIGPERAAAVRALRLAQARGDVRTPAQARAWLRRHGAVGTVW
ncbi:MAG: hypothetical protein ACOY3Y_11455 [Acidobacteriota bacterium]